jgi:hypothetical protein
MRKRKKDVLIPVVPPIIQSYKKNKNSAQKIKTIDAAKEEEQ